MRTLGIGGHQSATSRTDDWLTPVPIIAALGGAQSFDLDPCAPAWQPWPTAQRAFTVADNGLLQPWQGRIWCNPPYSQKPMAGFLARMVAHNRGTALIFARTETEAFRRFVWEQAAAVLFLFGRLVFHRPDGSVPQRGDGTGPQNAGAPSVLCAYGPGDADMLAFSGLPGQFVPLRIPRGVLVLAIVPTWREAIATVLADRRGPVRLDELYRAMAEHPKTRRNPNWRAKIRQQLQHGPFERVAPGVWRARHDGGRHG